MLKGSIVALITPFKSNKVDTDALIRLIEWHISQGTDGIVICGTTAEAANLTDAERNHIISITLSAVKGKVPVIVGCGTASMQQTLKYMEAAEDLGADATLVVTPYYVKPSQEGIIEYFTYLHEHTHLPIIVYNNPGRVMVDISIDTAIRLSKLPRILGFKDSHNDATRIMRMRENMGQGVALLSGEDSSLSAHLLNGADGAISVLGNVVPAQIKQLVHAWQENDMDTFEYLTVQLTPLILALSLETNPCTIKYAVSTLGYCTNEVRLPLLPIKDETKRAIDCALTDLFKQKQAA